MAGLPEDDYNDPLPGGLPSAPRPPGDDRAITPPSVVMRKRREREAQREEAKREEERRERERQETQRQLEGESRRRQEEARRREDARAGVADQNPRPPLQNIPATDMRRNTQRTSADAWGPDASLLRPRQPSGNNSTHRRGASQPTNPTMTGASTQRADAGQSQSQPKATQGGERSRSKTTSSFPHAFERWETLSSHWEGLTGYWIKKLDANKDELSRQPLNQQLARQVTDLSAAGANLFHAVVELQRLRASSERKFQRWFFETRKEQEGSAEKIAQLEKELKQARAGGNTGPTVTREIQSEQVTQEQIRSIQLTAQKAAQDEVERVKAASKKQLDEMRRELQISRDEARRGWEEIGRLEQSERDRMYCLKRGEPTLVGGVQVVPMAPRTAGSTRPATREGGLSSHPVVPDDMMQAQYNIEHARSETDTDPFTESTREAAAARAQGLMPQPQPQTTYPTSSAAIAASTRTKSASPALRPSTSAGTSPRPTATAGTSTSGTFPPRSESFSAPQPPTAPSAPSSASTAFYQQPASVLHQTSGAAPPTVLQAEDARSYATMSEDDYVLDSSGNPVRDAQGRPVVYQSRHSARSPSEASEDYGQPLHPGAGYAGYQAAQQARQSHAQQAQQAQQAQRAATSNGNGHGMTASAMPDYEGTGYGASEWANVPRHHHPTRLSDVLEEDERSRRTSPSRASSRSRGFR